MKKPVQEKIKERLSRAKENDALVRRCFEWVTQNDTENLALHASKLPPDILSSLLSSAAWDNKVQSLTVLAPLAKKSSCNRALLTAAKEDNVECLKALLPFSNPKANESEALTHALLCNRDNAVKFLYPFSDPKKALELARKEIAYEPDHFNVDLSVIERMIAEDSKKSLIKNIKIPPKEKKKKTLKI